jgi:hypothetical protein
MLHTFLLLLLQALLTSLVRLTYKFRKIKYLIICHFKGDKLCWLTDFKIIDNKNTFVAISKRKKEKRTLNHH